MSSGLAYDWFTAPAGYGPDFGRSIYILGTSAEGPIRQPVRVAADDDPSRIFGSAGTLSRALKRALDIKRDVVVYGVRISGEYATATIKGYIGDDVFGAVIDLRAAFGGAGYNDTKIEFQPQGITITPPTAVGHPVYYGFRDYPTIGELVRAINEDTDRGRGFLYASTPHGLLDSADTLWTGLRFAYLKGGQDGVDLDKNRLFMALEGTYATLEGAKVDYVVPVGAYVDDADLSPLYTYTTPYPFTIPAGSLRLLDTQDGNRPVTFHEQLLGFCRRQQQSGCMTHGVIGMRPLDNPYWLTAPEFSYTAMLLQRTAFRDRYGFTVASGGETVDRGHYCSIVCGDVLYNEGRPDEGYESGAINYAVLLASLAGDLTTTAKPVPGATKQRVEFTDREIKKLADLGVVTFRTSVKNGLVVCNGVTAALPTLDLHSIANVRMIAITLAHVDTVVEPYTGENLVSMIRSRELERKLRLTLDALRDEAGVLKAYQMRVQIDYRQRRIRLLLDLKPRSAVEYISTSAEMRYAS